MLCLPQMTDPRKLFLHELGDILYAERVLIKALPTLQKEATDREFAAGFKDQALFPLAGRGASRRPYPFQHRTGRSGRVATRPPTGPALVSRKLRLVSNRDLPGRRHGRARPERRHDESRLVKPPRTQKTASPACGSGWVGFSSPTFRRPTT
jgi:hypothetical protein